MPLGTGLFRPKTPPPHQSRSAFLRERNVIDNKICHVIPNPAEATTPWLTLVLGSGCTASRNQVNALVEVVAALEKPTHAPEDVAGMPVKEIVSSFATDLIRDRLRLRPEDRLGNTLKQLVAETQQEKVGPRSGPIQGAPNANGVRVSNWTDWIAGILLTSALITKLYYRIKSLGNDAPRRSDHNDEAVLTRESLSWGALCEDYVRPCRAILRDLRARVVEITESFEPPERVRENLMGTVKDLLERVGNGLTTDEVRIELADLHALAEFAWFCLTAVTTEPVYPGWSDLLLDLSNYDSPIGGRIGTPLFQSMTEAQGFIISRYQEVTRKSWARRVAGEAEEESLYRAAAELLNAQYLYRETRPENRRPPVTTAFVTSFDLELELSLLRLGRPFMVVLPVHLLNQKHSVAHTCWLVLNVGEKCDGESYDRLLELTEPGEGSYRILDGKWSETGPVIVRLAGCPLIRLPDLTGESPLKRNLVKLFHSFLWAEAGANDSAYRELINDKLQLQHAVVINEHDAILQSEIDLISIPQGDAYGLRYGLPAHFAAGNEHASRFWMLLGVQIHDSAVRHRVVTLISSLPHMASPGIPLPAQKSTAPAESGWEEAERKAGRRGVAINKYSTELEQDLLFWNGFDVVRDDVSVFAKDLQHCTAHLNQTRDFNQGGECNVI